MGMAQREMTPVELLEGLGHATGKMAAWKVGQQEEKLREARTIISDIVTAYAGCFTEANGVPSAEKLGEALEAGRQHILACGFREMPSEAFA